MNNSNLYNYNATVLEVIDGDTIDFEVDLGFEIFHNIRVRLKGIDTPELSSKQILQKQAANKVKKYVENMLKGKEIQIETVKIRDKKTKKYKNKTGGYSRYLADVWITDNNGSLYSLNNILLVLGYAMEYRNRKHIWEQSELQLIMEN